MSFADDLLGLAGKLANYTKSDFRDARIRRAISTADYALFHLLLEHGSIRITQHSGLQLQVRRAYSHADLAKVGKIFQSGIGSLPAYLIAPFGGTLPTLPAEIPRVAKAVVTLQEARHEADYDLSKNFTRADAILYVTQAKDAFTDWNAVVGQPQHASMCELFLTALLLIDRWRK